MSSELTWQLIRKHNSFIRRRDGATFSAEPNNLTNKHSFKYSGLANSSVVGVDFNRDASGKIVRGAVLSLKSRKASNASKPGKQFNKVTLTRDFRFFFFFF